MAKAAKPSVIKVTVNRNSIDGQFVTEKYAEKHKKTTETEIIKKIIKPKVP